MSEFLKEFFEYIRVSMQTSFTSTLSKEVQNVGPTDTQTHRSRHAHTCTHIKPLVSSKSMPGSKF